MQLDLLDKIKQGFGTRCKTFLLSGGNGQPYTFFHRIPFDSRKHVVCFLLAWVLSSFIFLIESISNFK
ncbi:hypothetical protein CH380_09625 [Leptospira adleri]|uniref:Uncharacterized protein n=1 Tax=Leptospira adleri TaxID=2023186 RepID=A0A2M9YPL7_9LEPT|nr:hypothetical protein CH380_09625 [Leptospira adleri]PJZ63025.1 hypothetical protein CH376_04985 [Leptospira adleri]